MVKFLSLDEISLQKQIMFFLSWARVLSKLKHSQNVYIHLLNSL